MKDQNSILCFQLYEKIKYGKLLLYRDEKKKRMIIVFGAYFGLRLAIWKGYHNMVVRFYKHIKNLMKNPDVKSSFPINFKTITLEYLNYLMFQKPHTYDKIMEKFKKNQNNYAEALILEKRKAVLDSLEKDKLKNLKINFSRNKVCLDIINLPFNVSRSYQSMFYCLEDTNSFLELEEALMWTYCCPYSPLNTGYRIDPF